MNYFVFIPSYDRLETLKNTTLALLNKHNIPNNIITVFVESEEMKAEYEKELNKDIILVVTNTKGIMEKRNYLEYYGYELHRQLKKPINILHIDDDIESIIDYDKPIENLDFTVKLGFAESIRTKFHFWGVSPFHNKFFLQKKITHSNKYIAGAFYGEVIDGTKEPVIVDIDHGEDLQRSMEAFLRDGGVVRLNDIALKTAYFPNSGITKYCGGVEKRKEEMIKNCLYLANRYGDMCRYKVNKWGATVRLNSFFLN